MNRISLFMFDVTQCVYRLSNNVQDSSECSFADWHRNRATGVDCFHATNHTVGRQHRNRAHAPLSKVLLHFGNHINRGWNIKPLRDDP
jgi:hypothetical protein